MPSPGQPANRPIQLDFASLMQKSDPIAFSTAWSVEIQLDCSIARPFAQRCGSPPRHHAGTIVASGWPSNCRLGRWLSRSHSTASPAMRSRIGRAVITEPVRARPRSRAAEPCCRQRPVRAAASSTAGPTKPDRGQRSERSAATPEAERDEQDVRWGWLLVPPLVLCVALLAGTQGLFIDADDECDLSQDSQSRSWAARVPRAARRGMPVSRSRRRARVT